jgi:hypothetical protein
MIKIRMIEEQVTDEHGSTFLTEKPETPFPDNAIRIVCADGWCYVVEQDGVTDGIPEDLLADL